MGIEHCLFGLTVIGWQLSHKDMQPPSLYPQSKALLIIFDLNLCFLAHTVHLHVLIRNFIICSGVRGYTTGGCSPPRDREGKWNQLELKTSVLWFMALLGPHLNIQTPPLCHSQEGMSDSVANVSDGLHINIVIMQRLWICYRACLCQEDTKPSSQFLWAVSLKGRKLTWIVFHKTLVLFSFYMRHLITSYACMKLHQQKLMRTVWRVKILQAVKPKHQAERC